ALNGSNDALQLDEMNIKAYLRKGIFLYHQNSIEDALQVFIDGLKFDDTNEQLKIWHDKCEKELSVPRTPPVVGEAPSYPSLSRRAMLWNKVEAEMKKLEKENEDDMDDANALYEDSDEKTRRAMNKSMNEPGRVTCEPPDGMEWKKYDSLI
ncbi:unnamed protein product, partial [Adineta steineri]